MTFADFMEWVRANLKEENKIDNLGGRAQFYAEYELQSNSIKIRNSKGSIGRIDKNDLRRIFNRYVEAPQSMKHKAKYYNNPIWCETPNMIFAPYIPAIVRCCIEKNE